jgi:hypothetical protein
MRTFLSATAYLSAGASAKEDRDQQQGLFPFYDLPRIAG